jgi:hypothetical protein
VPGGELRLPGGFAPLLVAPDVPELKVHVELSRAAAGDFGMRDPRAVEGSTGMPGVNVRLDVIVVAGRVVFDAALD